MKKRLKFECWNCKNEYSLTREIEGYPRLVVECPYCEHEAVVDLAPDRGESVIVYQDDGQAPAMKSLTLPDVLSTEPKPAEEE